MQTRYAYSQPMRVKKQLSMDVCSTIISPYHIELALLCQHNQYPPNYASRNCRPTAFMLELCNYEFYMWILCTPYTSLYVIVLVRCEANCIVILYLHINIVIYRTQEMLHIQEREKRGRLPAGTLVIGTCHFAGEKLEVWFMFTTMFTNFCILRNDFGGYHNWNVGIPMHSNFCPMYRFWPL